MIGKENDKKRIYKGVLARNLKASLVQFIKSEFPSFGGERVVGFFVEELLKMIDEMAILKDRLQVGQMLWYALDKDTRVTSKYARYKPVILTLVHEDDIKAQCEGKSQMEITSNGIARICQEAYKQGTVLSMRDISLILSRALGNVSHLRSLYEKKHKRVIPHQGSEHDMGRTLTHKAFILSKIIQEGRDPHQAAREVNHSQRAVDIYLKDYRRVKWCLEQNKSLEEIHLITNLSKSLIKEYEKLIKKEESSCHMA